MAENLLQEAHNWRELVLLVELAGWLHDLGKLSSGFLTKHSCIPAYAVQGGAEADEEPPVPSEGAPTSEVRAAAKADEWDHSKVFSYDAEWIEPPLDEALERPFTGPSGWLEEAKDLLGSGDIGVKALVQAHHDEDGPRLNYLKRLLIHADHKDSGEDEYNAVGTIDQITPVQRATVFGREEALHNDLDGLRTGMYPRLQRLLAEGDPVAKRGELWRFLTEKLGKGLGKSQRAANDVKLDQHTWGVATRLKAFLMRDLVNELKPTPDRTPDPRFRLLSVMWDSWALATPHARLSDVVGRYVLLKTVRDRLRDLIESELAIGNHIYEDDDGIHFLVADLAYQDQVLQRVRDAVSSASAGEVQPVVVLSLPTERVTELAVQMTAARKELPLVGKPPWATQWRHADRRDICPVCHKRPLAERRTPPEKRPRPEKRQLCAWCQSWRQAGTSDRLKQARDGAAASTPWTGEIADATGRVALIAALFDLEHWLDGEMLHTMFITSPQDLAHAYKVPQNVLSWAHLRSGADKYLEDGKLERPAVYAARIRAGEQERQRLLQDEKIPEDHKSQAIANVDRQLQEARADFWAALTALKMRAHGGERGRYVRHVAESLRGDDLSLTDAFVLALARKNPSASRLLRVWQTTHDFLENQARGLPTRLAQRQRLVFHLPEALDSGIYQAEVAELGRIELFVRAGGDAQTVDHIEQEHVSRLAGRERVEVCLRATEAGQALHDTYSCQKPQVESYLPYQAITTSPNLLLLMVPADQALQVADRLRSAYQDEFAKVQGRLPFHVGLVFMGAHYPMFAALDAARRMAESFEQVGKGTRGARLVGVDPGWMLHLRSDTLGEWSWNVPDQRGDGARDWYHPYVLVLQGETLESRPNSVAGPRGRWVHVSELRDGDQIGFQPNLFDFLFLDTVSSRLQVYVADDHVSQRRRQASVARQRHPYLLERLPHLQNVWRTICAVPGMTESRLQACLSLLTQKGKAWRRAGAVDYDIEQTFRWLADETAQRDLGGSDLIREAIRDGAFFDAVELHRHILKEKIEQTATSAEEAA